MHGPAQLGGRKSHIPFFTHDLVLNSTQHNTVERIKQTYLLLFPCCVALHCVELNFPTHSHITLMASNFSFLTLLMERRKPPKNSTNTNTNTNDLSFVKAAAWAWYQHNSGSKGKTITEFHATVTHHEPRPSRYRLEAMRTAMEAREGSPNLHAKKLSLLDEYEVQSISRQLNSLVEDSHHKPFNDADNNSTNGRTQKKKNEKKKVRKGFWLRHGAVCGGEKDVVDPSAVGVSRRGLPTKQVPAVNEVKRLPMEMGAL